MHPETKSLLYEGKAKRVYKTDKPDQVLVYFKNDATAFNAQKHEEFEGKGSLNCQISSFLFEFLQKQGIPTNLLEIVDECFMLAKSVDIMSLIHI